MEWYTVHVTAYDRHFMLSTFYPNGMFECDVTHGTLLLLLSLWSMSFHRQFVFSIIQLGDPEYACNSTTIILSYTFATRDNHLFRHFNAFAMCSRDDGAPHRKMALFWAI